MEITLDVNGFKMEGEYADCGSHQIRLTLDLDLETVQGIASARITELESELEKYRKKYYDVLGLSQSAREKLKVLGDLHAYSKLGYEGATQQLGEKMDELLPASETAAKYP